MLSETSATLPASHPTGYEFGGDSNGAQAFTQGSQVVESSSSYDAWGNAEASCAGANLASGTSGCLRYGEVDYDTDYDMFPTTERIARDGTGGAFTYLETSGVWDRGLGVLTSMTDPTGESTSVGYDGFGRLTQVTPPAAEGCSAMPVQRFVYDLAPGGAPISVVTTYAEQDCAAIGADQIETRTYVDGLGRTRASLSPASAADPGAWIQSGITILNQRGTVKRAYQPEWVMESDPSIARALRIPSTPYEWAGYDSFDRPRCATSACGQMSCTTYHALTVDECDHLDMSSDPLHAGTCTTTRTDGHGRTVDQVLRNRQVPHGPIEYYRLWSDYRADGAVTLLTRAETTTDGLRATALVVAGHQVQRTFTYDSVGRRIGTTDPDSDSLDAACTSRNCTWRYLFSEVGDLVAVRDPRGCGQNFYYDRLGRLIGEDYVECGESQGSAEISAETVPATAVAMEELAAARTVDVRYHYETAPGWAGYTQVTANPSRYRGRLVAVADRGQRSAMAYDRRGNATWSVREMAVIPDAGSTTVINADPGDGLPPTVSDTPAAPTTREYDTAHPYVRTASFDHAGRPTSMTLPSDPDWTGTGLAPEIGGTIAYDERGLPSKVELTVDNAPRTIVESIRYSEHGLVERVQYGDDDGRAPTVSTTTYDACLRPREFETNRAPTAGTGTDLALVTTPMHQRLTWDEANNLVRIEDLRDASEWPDGYRPQTVDVFHDALYRVVNAHYTYAGGTAGGDQSSNWRSDMATHRADDPMRTTPAPMAAALPPERVRSLTWQYDWLGNMQEWTDDAHAFYERSLGDIENGADRTAHERPAALHLATDIRQSSQPPVSIDVGEDRGGWVELTYGESGNVVEMTVHGQCRDPSASSACWDDLDLEGSARASHLRASCFCATEQHYAYRWDELNRLAEARRYDRMGGSTGSWVAAVRQRYRYDSANQRTVKQTLDVRVGEADPERIALYVFPGDFERRGLVRGAFGDEYEASTGLDTETQYLVGGARVVWKTRAGVAGLNADQRVTVPLTDLVQNAAAVLDIESGELLEASTYYPTGNRETWAGTTSAEPRGFSRREGDAEVGLHYHGERYLLSGLGRWASPDPLEVISVGSGGEPANGFHFLAGDLLRNADVSGLVPEFIGYIYVLEGTLDGVDYHYTGQTAQELRQRFSRHRWRRLLEQEGTVVRVVEVEAELNIAASNRRNFLSARREALGAAEQHYMEQTARRHRRTGRVRGNGPNAAAPGNAATWRARHRVRWGRLRRIPRSLALPRGATTAFIGFALWDVMMQLRQTRTARYVMEPTVLLDEYGDASTLEVDEGLVPIVGDDFFMRYQSGSRRGRRREIDYFAFRDLVDEAEAMWGYIDLLGEWQPGLLRRSLPEIDPSLVQGGSDSGQGDSAPSEGGSVGGCSTVGQCIETGPSGLTSG
ncbi:MAG: RHS repeat-associated core domain-containing protein [Sandaracinaceae bacterium]